MRITPDTKQAVSIGSTKKGRKRTFSGQDQMDETEVKLEVKSWILDTSDQVTVGEVYNICGGSEGRLQLTYAWERRSKPEQDSDHTTGKLTNLVVRIFSFEDIIYLYVIRSRCRIFACRIG